MPERYRVLESKLSGVQNLRNSSRRKGDGVKRIHIQLVENLRKEAEVLNDPLLLRFYDMAVLHMRSNLLGG